MSDCEEGEGKDPPWKVNEIWSVYSSKDFIGSFTDLTFVCLDGSVSAHKAVIGPLSLFLLPLLSSTNSHISIILPSYGVDDVNSLLRILYTGEAKCSLARADKLLSLTKTLKMKPIPISYTNASKTSNGCSSLNLRKSGSRKVKYGDQGVRNVVKKEMNEELVQRVLSKTVDKESNSKEIASLGFENNFKASVLDLKVCYICKAVIRGHNIFLEHLRLHREEGGPYACPQLGCHSQDNTGLLLHRHFTDLHLTELTGENFKDSLIGNKDTIDNAKTEKYKCDLCCLKWTNFSLFKVHMNSVHNIRPLKCDHCDQRFNDKLGLKTHVQAKHMPEKNYPCDVCKKKFKTIRFLYHHRRQIHELGDSRVAKCETCGFVSKGLANLKKHIKTVHSTKTSNHQCSYCPSMFKSKYNLTCHERTHNGEAPYPCNFCGNKFKRAHHLKGHLEICKKNTNISTSLENVEFLVDQDNEVAE